MNPNQPCDPNSNDIPLSDSNSISNPFSINPSQEIININDPNSIPNPEFLRTNTTITREEIEMDKKILRSVSLSQDPQSYLPITNWSYLSNDNFITIESTYTQILSQLNQSSYNHLLTTVRKCNLTQVHKKPDVIYNVSTLGTLESLIEENFLSDPNNQFQMVSHFLKLEPHIHKWRHIKGEGNCFYRAVIFAFLENIIITNNLYLLKEFAIGFYTKINKQNPFIKNIPYLYKAISSLNTEITLQLLHLLIDHLENEQTVLCYEVLIKAFCFCSQFDLAIIFYLKYLLYEYIKENYNKAYSEEFSVLIGNLLPKEYQSEKGEFYFEKYYEEQLLQLGIDAEKIVIYVTPFVLKCDLKVIMYDYELNTDDFLYVREFKCGLNDKMEINVLFRKIHYDISYSKEYFDKYQSFLSIYTNVNEVIKVLDSYTVEGVRRLLDGNIEGDVFSALIMVNEGRPQKKKKVSVNQENDIQNMNNCFLCSNETNNSINVPLCGKCLENELMNQIIIIYNSYLHLLYKEYKTKANLDFKASFESYFANKTMVLFNKKQNIQNLTTLTNCSFMEYIIEAKKRICLFCNKEINNLNGIIKLPCSCYLCSQKCYNYFYDFFLFHDYERKVAHKYKKPIFTNCPCGYQYTFNDYRNIYQNVNDKLKDNLRNIIKEIWIKTCANCNKSINEEEFSVFTFKSKKLGVFEMKNAKHGLCGRCERFFKNGNKVIDCIICNEKHEMLKTKVVNSNQDDCVII